MSHRMGGGEGGLNVIKNSRSIPLLLFVKNSDIQ